MSMFENFPYTDLHNLNLDWIIKIAKDFLDQYTHIQQLISDGEESLQNLTTEGLQQLQDKADNLESLLQSWYDTHSADIANQLADALSDLNSWYTSHLAELNAWYTLHQNYLDSTLLSNIAAFNAAAEEKAAETIRTIPADYTTLSDEVVNLHDSILFDKTFELLPGYISNIDGTILTPSENGEVYTQKLYGIAEVFASLTFSTAHDMWFAIGEYADDGTFIRRQAQLDNASTTKTYYFKTSKNCAYIIISFRAFNTTYSLVKSFTGKSNIDETLLIKGASAESSSVHDIVNNKTSYVTNLYNPYDEDVVYGGFFLNTGEWYAAEGFNSTGFIPCTPGKRYKKGSWTEQHYNSHVVFYTSAKVYHSGIMSLENGCFTVPEGVAYFRTFTTDEHLFDEVIIEGFDIVTTYGLKYNIPTACPTGAQINNNSVTNLFENIQLTPYDENARGALKNNGTIDTSFSNIIIHKYKAISKELFLNGVTSVVTSETDFVNLWFVGNGNMISSLALANQLPLHNAPLTVPDGTQEVWTVGGNMTVSAASAIDGKARNDIPGSQWRGKTWYAYGTSITSSDYGKYANNVASMSGMVLVNKGLGGQGIGNLGAYSTGAVYDAVCNITDGKLNADIITLETGANDVNASVPLGTVYDTGRTTLAGCLNDCIRYLLANTKAQIVIMNSPYSTDYPTATNQVFKWRQMMKEICYLNGVHFIDTSCNLGTAKLISSQGSDYVSDNIHQTELGGMIFAENIWYNLRNIPVFYHK